MATSERTWLIKGIGYSTSSWFFCNKIAKIAPSVSLVWMIKSFRKYGVENVGDEEIES